LFGIAVATYLTWVHYDAGALVCGLGDCHTVQASAFATIGPVPVALLGVGMYAAILLCNFLVRLRRVSLTAATTAAFAIALSGTLYAAYLTWLELAVIGAICQWCVASALITVALAITEGVALWEVFAESNGDAPETESEATAS
jgi:uncharacterized membrane protein